MPDFNRDFILTTDASNFAVSYILSQKDDQGRERVIEYGANALQGNQLHWTVSEKEALCDSSRDQEIFNVLIEPSVSNCDRS
jgi:hypothetical protein